MCEPENEPETAPDVLPPAPDVLPPAPDVVPPEPDVPPPAPDVLPPALSDLPMIVIETIAARLSPRDSVALSLTCSDLAWVASHALEARYRELRRAYASVLSDAVHLVRRTADLVRNDAENFGGGAVQARGWEADYYTDGGRRGGAMWSTTTPRAPELGIDEAFFEVKVDRVRRRSSELEVGFRHPENTGDDPETSTQASDAAGTSTQASDAAGTPTQASDAAGTPTQASDPVDYHVCWIQFHGVCLREGHEDLPFDERAHGSSLVFWIDLTARTGWCDADNDGVIDEGPAGERLRARACGGAWLNGRHLLAAMRG